MNTSSTTLKSLLMLTGLSIHDIINLRASAYPFKRALYKPSKYGVLWVCLLQRKAGRGQVALAPYTPESLDSHSWKNRQSIWEGTAQILLKAHYLSKPDFWIYSEQERLYNRPDPSWQATNAPWQMLARPVLSPQEKLERKTKALRKREGSSGPCAITHQEQQAFSSWAERGF